ncbi:MAG: pyridoxamine 5'-phosphate oxidase [Ponticaulis sp.]|nr:pyridoxamine 5'-phosphate oxidase [Ponticaulis sp.]|tara:strand:- start:67607 stop:68200 length:594 start_codon:yes stop_codon:yes gene_type:complete
MTDTTDRFEKTPSLIPIRQEVIHNLTQAADSQSKSPMRQASVATIGYDGSPQVRIMIVRAFEPETMALTVFTDARSPKVTGLNADARMQLMMYDPGTRTQIRISGQAELHHGDDLTEKLWKGLPEYGRGDYLSRQPPGEQIAHPGDSWEDTTLGNQNFMVLRIAIQEIDWLKLSAQGHRRALLTWDNGEYSARWLTP